MRFDQIETINIIPLPPKIETKNAVKDLLAIDQKKLKEIQKQYKDSIEKAFLFGRKKRIYKKKKKPQQLVVMPIIHNRFTENRIFYLYAGVVLPCDFSYEARVGLQDKQAFMLSCRPLVSIEKRPNYSILTYSYNFKGLENFDFLIDIYKRKGKQNYYNLAQILTQFQSNIQIWKKQSQLLAPQRLSNPEEYKLKYQSFMNDCLRKVDQLDQSKFYVFGFVFYNYETDNLESKTVGFSKGLLSLLGTDQEQFTNIVLRCGESQYSVGEALINALIVSLLPLACSSIVYQKSAADSVLISYDGFEIPYKEIRSYYLPDDNHHLGYFEIGFGLIEYDVSITILQQLLTMRAKRYYVDKIKEFENIADETFEYSMNSQLFIEKFYPDAITNEFLRCKYKFLSETGQQMNNLEVITTVQQNDQNENSNLSYSNLQAELQLASPSTTQQTKQKYSSFLDISDCTKSKQIFTTNDIDAFIQSNGYQQKLKMDFFDKINSENHQGLGYSMQIQSNPNNNQQRVIQQSINSDQLSQQNRNLSSQISISQEVEMHIEPFQYHEIECDLESTTDNNSSQKNIFNSTSEIEKSGLLTNNLPRHLSYFEEEQNQYNNNKNHQDKQLNSVQASQEFNKQQLDFRENENMYFKLDHGYDDNNSDANQDNNQQRVQSYRVQLPISNSNQQTDQNSYQQQIDGIQFMNDINDTLNTAFPNY